MSFLLTPNHAHTNGSYTFSLEMKMTDFSNLKETIKKTLRCHIKSNCLLENLTTGRKIRKLSKGLLSLEKCPPRDELHD